MAFIEKIQRGMYKFAKFEQKHYHAMTFFFIFLTLFMIIGLLQLEVESDFSQFSPSGLRITQLTKDVSKMFSSSDGIVIILEIDDDTQSELNDIRDPSVIEFLYRIKNELHKDELVEDSFSLGNFFTKDALPKTLEESKAILNQIPQSDSIISDDFRFTIVYIAANVGSSTEQINAANDRVKNLVEKASPPAGVKVVVTGEPALGTKLFELLISDSITVLIYAIIFIFILLIVTELSFRKAFFALIPLLIGLTWAAGALGWIGIPITIATAGLSAMLLGLGVEYAIFLMERYKEEREHHETSEAINRAISNVGASIFSSGGTTAIGFFALALSIFPALSGMGKSLGLGIAMLFLSTITIMPLVILYDNKIQKSAQYSKRVEKPNKIGIKLKKGFKSYGRLLSHHPFLILFIVILTTILMIYGISTISNTTIDFNNVLPNDLPELKAFSLLESEFGGTTGVRIYVFIDPETNSTPIDIRSPEYLEYINILSQKSKYLDEVISVSSITETLKQQNNGKLTLLLNDPLFENPQVRSQINDDFSGTIIQIDASKDANDKPAEFVRELNNMIEETRSPPGVSATAVGDLPTQVEQDAIIGPDSGRTSIIALVVIILFLLFLTYSIRKTFLPLITVILGIIWTLGLIGLFKIPFTSITSSVITMTIGIGIDFGLQLMTRFDFELKTHEKAKAMENTIGALLTPMLITVISAVIGFRAMNLGELSLLADLGTTMSIAVAASMLASVTGVAAIMILLYKAPKR